MHLCVTKEMNNIEDRHFSLNRALLLTVGLWPYQRSRFVQIQSFCFFAILITSIVFQLTTFVTSKCTTNLVTKVLAFTFAYIGLVIKYNSFCVNRGTVKFLMELLQYICDNLKDNNERAIIERCGKNAKRFTTLLITFYVCCLFIILIGQLWPEFLNVLLSVNNSRIHRLQISTEYFIDEEKYFYLLVLHLGVAGFLGVFAMAATGAMLVAYLEHACGMFKIASYRIEQGINIHELNDSSLWNEKLSYEGLICAVDIHRKAMMFCKYLVSKFEISFMLLIVFGVLTLSLTIFRIFQLMSSEYNIGELLMLLASASICIIYMFFANFVGQDIIDHNNHVYETAYKVQWYKTPLYIQRLILLLLQRGNKTFGLNIGGLFIASLQCFATLANASISYFTVMHSM